MATVIFSKKVLFEKVLPYSDDFIGSVNTLRNKTIKKEQDWNVTCRN